MNESLSIGRKIGNGLYWGFGVLILSFLGGMIGGVLSLGILFRYFLQLVIGIVYLVNSYKKSGLSNWLGLFIYEVAILATAVWNLFSYGGMHGLSYLGAVIVAFFGGTVFLLLLIISILLCLIRWKKNS